MASPIEKGSHLPSSTISARSRSTTIGEASCYFFDARSRARVCSILRGTSQPPLPLHELRAAQPLSPDAQPPIPLQPFLPLQACCAARAAQPPLPLQSFFPAQPLLPQPCL